MDIKHTQTLESLSYRRLHLYSDYKIISSNHIFEQGTLPYIKHTPYRKQLEELLTNSDGGAILVTGFRGVGKSTMVANAVHTMNQNGNCRVIPISVMLPTEKNYGQVLIEIIRRLYETLSRSTLWNDLKAVTQGRIQLAYSRTLMNIKHSQNLAASGNLSVQSPFGWLPDAELTGSKAQAEEKSYLSFSEQDIEYELIQCIEALSGTGSRNKVLIIIDEIDKITSTQEGIISFDNLLERMKNLISSTNMLFVFVAGIDVYKRWESDSQKVNSLYDSLFSHHIYLPCIWDSVEDLFDVIKDRKYIYKPVDQSFRRLVQTEYTTILEQPFRMVGDYILFKGKGLPRKMLRSFNDFIVWENQQPCFLLTSNRIRAITQVSKILDKFRSYMATERTTTLFERDIYYSLFLSMLEFLFSQEKLTFTEEQIQETLLDNKGSPELCFENILKELLLDFEKLSFIKKTETEYEIIDNTILNRDPALKVLDHGLLLREQKEEELPEQVDVSVDERFQNQIKLAKSTMLATFWSDYEAEQVILDSKDMMIFRVKTRSSGLRRYAVIYKRKARTESGEKKKKPDNLYSTGTYCFRSPYFLDTEDHIEAGLPVTSLRTAVEGYALEHLIEAKLNDLTIYQIIRQVLSMTDYLHKKGFGNVRLRPDNIMLCKDGTIKILDLKHLYSFSQGNNPYTTRIYSAPEVYLSKCGAASDYYSVGILLTEMLIGKSLNRHYHERHIDVNIVMTEISCSHALKEVLVKATDFDPDNRYKKSGDLIAALDKCPEFRMMKKTSIPKGEEGTVNGRDIRAAALITPEKYFSDYARSVKTKYKALESEKVLNPKTCVDPAIPYMMTQPLSHEIPGHTGILGGAYFGDSDFMTTVDNVKNKNTMAYLVRQNNNERIALNNLNKPVFRIGRQNADYILDNSMVSRRHAEFVQNNGIFYIRDLNASNGTYVNSQRLMPNETRELKHGDRIRLATEEFVFYEH